MNYFELFSLPAIFAVDQTRLSEIYRDLQRQYHPDKFAMSADSERLLAMQKSTEINDAYHTLKDSCLRAQYLLLLAGVDIALEEKTFQDTQFLIQQMAWREQIALFTADDEQEIERFTQKREEQIRDLEALIGSQLAAKQFKDAADSTRKLKFMLKLLLELTSIEEKLFDLND